MRVTDIPGIERLTAPEKLLLAEDLWDSIAADEASVPIPDSHLQELDQRLARHKAEPGRLLTLEELQARVRARQ